MASPPVPPPYILKYMGDKLFSNALPSRKALDKLLDLERNIKTKEDKAIFMVKITTLNESMYKSFIQELDQAWNRQRSHHCIHKMHQFLAWIDCRSVCWRHYRRMIRVFRHYLLRMIMRMDKWMRYMTRTRSAFIAKTKDELTEILESGPLSENIYLSSTVRSSIRSQIYRRYNIGQVVDTAPTTCDSDDTVSSNDSY